MFDYHVHSDISFDARSPMEDVVASAAQKGLKEICFTEHMDIDPNGLSRKFELNLPRYIEVYNAVMEKNYPILVRQGIEIGVLKERSEEMGRYISSFPFDFVICSQHFAKGFDPYYPGFYEGRTMHEAYTDYLESVLGALKVFNNYDVVGHIGYPCKYYRGTEPCKMQYSEFPELIDEILLQAAQNGKGIEANTSSIPKTGDTVATSDMLKRFRQLGGEIVTVGSDSHTADNVGKYISQAIDIVKDAGFSYVCTFEKRQPVFHKI